MYAVQAVSVSSVSICSLFKERPGEGKLLAFIFLGALHFLLGDAKALAVANVQLHLAEYVCDDAGGLSQTKLNSSAP